MIWHFLDKHWLNIPNLYVAPGVYLLEGLHCSPLEEFEIFGQSELTLLTVSRGEIPCRVPEAGIMIYLLNVTQVC